MFLSLGSPKDLDNFRDESGDLKSEVFVKLAINFSKLKGGGSAIFWVYLNQ